MRNHFLCRAAAVLLAACAWPAPALQPRPDREDAEYLELATKYASAARLSTGQNGVLVNARWVLTTARAARDVRAALPRRPTVRVGEREVDVADAFPHPKWLREGGPHDVGLVLLKDAVRGVEPTVVAPSLEPGRAIAIAAFGPDGRRRASINTVDALEALAFASRVKPLEEASDLQAALGPGDLGAPAYLASPEGIAVAGIAFAVEGATERFIRAGAYLDWIESTMLEVNTREAAELLGQ